MFVADKNAEKSIIIAEVGQNHQGSVETALRYVEALARTGVDFVKFQMRDNKTLFTGKAYNKPYDYATSFGSTYGEHREKLELDKDELILVRKECERQNVGFMCTPFDEASLQWLETIDVDVIKIASFDLGNIPFIDLIAKTKKTGCYEYWWWKPKSNQRKFSKN